MSFSLILCKNIYNNYNNPFDFYGTGGSQVDFFGGGLIIVKS